MYLNRPLIKLQARELLRGNVFKMFVIAFIVSLCASLIPGALTGAKQFSDLSRWDSYFSGDYDDFFDDYFDEYVNGDDDSDYFNDFNEDYEGSDFFNFGRNGELSLIPADNAAVADQSSAALSTVGKYSYLVYAAEILLSPLLVTLAGFFVLFIRGKKYEFDEGLRFVFKSAFTQNYGKKIGVAVLKSVVTALLSMLFFIPGIIFSYSSYFAYQLMCDYPKLSPWQAIKLSKKIVSGNRFELFVMNLSFLPWALLCIFVFPMIYVVPYIEATNALYYENFRLRAIQQGRVTEDDFLSDAERCAKYGARMNNQYYSPVGYQQGTYYQAPQQQYYPYGAPYYSAPYQQYNPVANQQYYNPAQNTPPAGTQTPQKEAHCETAKPAEPTDFPLEEE